MTKMALKTLLLHRCEVLFCVFESVQTPGFRVLKPKSSKVQCVPTRKAEAKGGVRPISRNKNQFKDKHSLNILRHI